MRPERSQKEPPQPFTMNDLFDQRFKVRHTDATWLAGMQISNYALFITLDAIRYPTTIDFEALN